MTNAGGVVGEIDCYLRRKLVGEFYVESLGFLGPAEKLKGRRLNKHDCMLQSSWLGFHPDIRLAVRC